MTALSLFISNTNSSIQTNAGLLVASSNGSSSSNPQTIGTASAWGEVAVGNFVTWASGGSIGSPDGFGGLYDAGYTVLAGQTISGNWSASFFLASSQSGKTITGPLTLRIYKYNKSTSTYTSIGNITTSSQVLTFAGITVTFASTSLPSVSFSGAGTESIYYDIWDDITGNTMTSGGGIVLLFGASSTIGYSGAALVTPGYNPTSTGNVGSSTETTIITESVSVAIASSATETPRTTETLAIAIAASATDTTIATETINGFTVSTQAVSETTRITETAIGMMLSVGSVSETTRTTEATSIVIRSSISETTRITESAVGVTAPVSSSTDPDAQMLNDDLLIQYAVLKMATLIPAIARIFIVRYPPARVLSEHSIPGELDVLLVGEDFNQVHRLSTINEVAAFIVTYS
jgi:hypothetical protein